MYLLSPQRASLPEGWLLAQAPLVEPGKTKTLTKAGLIGLSQHEQNCWIQNFPCGLDSPEEVEVLQPFVHLDAVLRQVGWNDL